MKTKQKGGAKPAKQRGVRVAKGINFDAVASAAHSGRKLVFFWLFFKGFCFETLDEKGKARN